MNILLIFFKFFIEFEKLYPVQISIIVGRFSKINQIFIMLPSMPTESCTYRQTDGQTDRQTDGQTDRQTNVKINVDPMMGAPPKNWPPKRNS